MEPTMEERATLTNVMAVAKWCHISDEVSAEVPNSTASQWLCHLGVENICPPRVIASAPQEEIDEAIKDFKTAKKGDSQGQPPSFGLRAKLRLFFSTCKVLSGSLISESALQTAIKEAVSKAVVPASKPSAAKETGLIKLSQVIDQTEDDEISRMDDDDITKAYSCYYNRFGDMPPNEEEPTAEQLAGVSHLMKVQRPPYVNMAIFGPHGYRITRRLKLAGLKIGRDGEMRTIEIEGPPTIDDWVHCFKVLRTILIMLDQVDVAALDAYQALITKYARTYGKDVWLIIYQADVRCRLENFERIRRRLLSEQESRLNPKFTEKPWNVIFREAVKDADFWKHELEETCILVLTRTANLNSMLSGDTPVGHDSLGSTTETPKGTPRPAPRPASAGPAAKKQKNAHSLNQDGSLATNRSGTILCRDWQSGRCTETAGQSRCSRDQSRMHQCSKCLSPDHGASTCSKPVKMPMGKGKKGKGGKGKGKADY